MRCALRRTSAPLLLASLGLIGLDAAPGFAAPPVVVVSQPLEREVADAAEFAGRLVPGKYVELRARVTGYLDKVNFKEGAEVKQGDVLFEIDARPYRAALAQAEAALEQAKARRDSMADIVARDVASPAAVGAGTLAQDRGELEQAKAAVAVAQAAQQVAQVNVGFTKIPASFNGQIARIAVDPGNDVLADATLLGVLVSVDPIYATFDVDERTFLRFSQSLPTGKTGEGSQTPLEMALANEEGGAHKGQLANIDPKEDRETGTIRMRGVFANTDGLFLPGMLARVRMPLGKPYPVLLVPDEAVLSARGQKFLLVVNEKNQVKRVPVTVGGWRDGRREIQGKVTKDDWVVVEGAPTLQDGDEVEVRRSEPPPAPKNKD